jgi:hypothetical protein
MIYLLLSENRLYRENDLALIMDVCERKGYCSHTVVDGRRCYVFYEDKLSSMPSSFLDTVRRTRQKLMQEYPDLKPGLMVQEKRERARNVLQGVISDVL